MGAVGGGGGGGVGGVGVGVGVEQLMNSELPLYLANLIPYILTLYHSGHRTKGAALRPEQPRPRKSKGWQRPCSC